MIEVKSTKGIEKNMHSEIENLVHKAYEEGKADGLKEAKATDSCSWEKGVTDAWECVTHTFNLLSTECDFTIEERKVMKAVAHILEDSRPIEQTRVYVETRNHADDEEADEPIEVGDVVLDPSGNECVITNDDTHYHVIYTSNGKTYKWNKDTKFKPIGKRVVGVGRIRL